MLKSLHEFNTINFLILKGKMQAISAYLKALICAYDKILSFNRHYNIFLYAA